MATRYSDYTEDYADDAYEPSASDGVKGKGWGALILGACLLPTPLMGLGAVLVALGVALLSISPKLQQLENEADAHIATEQALGRSGCGFMIWFCLVGVALLFGAGVLLTAGLLLVRG